MIGSNLKKLYLDADIKKQIVKIAKTDYPILIEGESGVGKDYLAEVIHKLSRRKSREVVVIDLAAIPADLIEKEMFGAVSGAYTGLKDDYEGLCVQADKSTLILDGIGDIPLELQGKLLQFLDRGSFTPVGGSMIREIDVRVIALSSKKILDKINNGTFREDLYYRINTFSIDIPPLEHRKEYIPTIVKGRLAELKSEKLEISRYTMSVIKNHKWNGNIRELINRIDRAVTLSNGNEITLDSLLLSSNNNGIISGKTLKEATIDFKRSYVARVLEDNSGNVTKSSEVLGIQRTYLSRLIKELNIY